jgi:tetratricopeptide (TPR) repeat protein
MRPLLAAALLAALTASASAGWWDDAGAARRATLEEVRKDPDRWRDVPLVLDVVFARTAEPGNAYFTRFTAREWRAVLVLPAATRPEALDKVEPFSRVFVRRGAETERRLDAVARGGRVQLRAAVRDAVKGEPWMEVLDVVADGDPLAPEEAARLAQADDLLARDNAAAAEPLYRALLAARALSKPQQAELWRRVGAACRAQRRFDDAAAALTRSLDIEPDAATERLLAAAKELAVRMPAQQSSPQFSQPSAPISSAAVGSPLPPPPARKLLPPVGIEAPASAAPTAAPTTTPSAPTPAQSAPAVAPLPPPAAPATPAAPPAEELAAPKPRLAGPK